MAAAYDATITGYMRKSNLGNNCQALVSLVDLYMRYVSFPSLRDM